MPELSADQRRQLEALRQAYEAELPEKLTSIARAAAALRPGGADRAGVEELHRLVHRLAGSSAIWGFTALSKAAGELETLVLAALDGAPGPRADLSDAVRRLLAQIEHAVPAPGAASAPPAAHHK